MFLMIANKLAIYSDGVGKTSVMQQLLGKSGANLLPVMKDLADVGILQIKVTNEQAQQADDYEKNLVRIAAANNAVYKVIAFQTLPIMNAFSEAMLEAIKGGSGLKKTADDLAADNSIQEWAREGARALAFVVDGFDVVARTAMITVATIKSAKDVFSFKSTGDANADATAGNAMFADWKSKVESILMREQFSSILEKKLEKVSKYKVPGVDGTVVTKPNVKFNPTKGDPAGPVDDPSKKELEGYLKQQENFIAAERTLQQTREQYLSAAYNQEYIDANTYYSDKRALIEDALKVELEAYDKEAAAITIKMAMDKTLVDGAEDRKKLDDVAAKRAAAEIKSSKELSDTVREQDAIYRQFELTTIAVAHAAKLADDQQQFQIDMMGRSTLEIAQLTAARTIDLALQERIRDLRKKDPTANVSDAVIQAEAQKQAAIDRVTESYNKQRDAIFGASEAVRKYSEDAMNTGTQIENMMSNSFKGMEDALVTFVTTGKLNFTDLANSIVADITRIIIKQQIMLPLMSAMGMGGGAGAGGFLNGILGSLFGGGAASAGSNIGAYGGSMNNPSAYLGSFASGLDYVPHDGLANIHAGERIIPASQNNGSLGNSTVVQVHVTPPQGGNSRATAMQWGSDAGRQIQIALARNN